MARRRSGFRGVTKLRRTLRRMPEEINEPVKREMKRAAESIGDEARANVPVRTGALRENLLVKVSGDGLSARIGYHRTAPGFKRAWKKAGWRARFVEFGTVKVPGVFMITNAWERKRPGLVKDVGRAVSKAVRKASAG